MEAVHWYRLAAEQGYAFAQYNLGDMYYTGDGIPQDYVLAHMWWNLAASRLTGAMRESVVNSRDRIEARMASSQLAAAQRLAREWAPRVNAEPDGLLPPNEDADSLLELREGSGTAFIVDPSGVLLTAHHVIDQAVSIRVSCNGRAPVAATVTSSSSTADLAVIITASDLGTDKFLRLSLTQQPALGDNVFTVGYPTPRILGRDPKYTNGTVSALSGLGGDASFLQISVPIQPGNSGAPLVNEAGDVIGVMIATADAPMFFETTDSLPQNINWAAKSIFASAMFIPPVQGTGFVIDPDDVIADVTEATCLVETSGAMPRP